VKRAVDDLTKAHQEQFDAATRSGNGEAQAAFQGYEGARKLSAALGKAADQAGKAEEASKLAAKAGLSDWQRQQDLITQVEGAYDDAANSATDFINKQGDFDPAGFIKHMEKVRSELEHYRDDLAKLNISPAAEKYLESQGADTAAAMVRGYKNATPRQQAQLAAIWNTAGAQNATTYGDALGKSISAIKVPKVKVPVPVVPAPDTSKFDAFFRSSSVKQIVIEGVTRSGKRVF
jgi:hypothetical protein